MSELTTTGATIFEDFSRYGRGVFFWRSLSQWLGGLGVIALFVAVMPRLAIAGRQLFFAEAAGPTDEKLTPQIRRTAAALWVVYAGLTAAETLVLKLLGMTWFDSACHAFTTLGAGGFSPHPQSIMGYASPAIEWTIILSGGWKWSPCWRSCARRSGGRRGGTAARLLRRRVNGPRHNNIRPRFLLTLNTNTCRFPT